MLLKDVFGDSSDDEQQQHKSENLVHEHQAPPVICLNSSWERVREINGLSFCRDFLSSEGQSSLLSAIEREGWFTEASRNQAMRFGDLPAWAIKICNAIREVVLSEDFSELMDTASYAEDEVPSILPPSILWREPLFDQLIVNIYQPGNLCSC